MRVLLISTYELGRQPFGLASPAAWLRKEGYEVRCLDLSVERLDGDAVQGSELIAFYLPMHTATRIAVPLIERIAGLEPDAHLCAYGLYAPVNTELLRSRGVATILGGEFEEGLLHLARRIDGGEGPTGFAAVDRQTEPEISLARQSFRVPDRSDLPPLTEYAHLHAADGGERTVGATEASRGCKHMCRHCPIVPVYGGRFRVVQPEVVLEDVRRQVEAGAEHITFGDPDFFNGPAHARGIVEELHRQHPDLTYDVTIKVEHLIDHADLLTVLRETGCAFVTSAVESLDDRVLEILDKGHTRDDFHRAVALCRDAGLPLQPTFVPFTPWTTIAGHAELLATLAELDLVDSVPPIQLAIRLLIPAGSLLLERPEVQEIVGPFDPQALTYHWEHPDPRVDELQGDLEAMVRELSTATRAEFFRKVCARVAEDLDETNLLPEVPPGRPRVTIPYLSEPWYC